MLRSVLKKTPSPWMRQKVMTSMCNGMNLSTKPIHTPQDIDQSLRDDVKNFGKILGETIKREDPKVYEAVERLRSLGRKWRVHEGETSAFEEMVASVEKYDPDMLYGVSRSFASFLALANSAENHHRIRRLKSTLTSTNYPYGLWPKEDSCAGSIQKLVQKDGVKPEAIVQALSKQKVELVLTAHPTEVNRRTILRKHKKLREILEQLDRKDLSLFDRRKLQAQMRSEILAIWESDNLRRSKPTPVDEARFGLAVAENVLWDAVPGFLRKLDDVVKHELHASLPIEFSPLKISSWMGGDRDGNPNVTPEITHEVVMLNKWMAATLYKEDMSELRATLSMTACSEELEALITNAREPYREILKNLENRLQATIEWTENEMQLHTSSNRSTNAKPIRNSRELMEPLQLIYRSLVECGMSDIADGPLLDTIRRVATFGVSLLALDVRQESTRHSEALDAITRYLGVGSYLQWDEQTRRNWLQSELSSRRPLMPRNIDYEKIGFSSTVVDTLRTFETIAKIDSEALGAYVISQCQQASDILAVTLLQQDAGVAQPLRVVPLFETLDDLQRAPSTINDLFSMPAYRGRINSKQEIMVGYSDSAKDAGRIAAAWEQYNSQLSMIEVANKHGVEVTFFHGKGGTVGRGGNPALYQAILAHPPGTINGRFRITEQGEMITQNLGQVSVAERTFDLFTAGVLAEQFVTRPEVKPEWRQMMERLSEVSCKVYRDVVRGEPRFVPYFRAATPEMELSGLNVGSRPQKRNPKGGVDSLRAIPWNFAWTQTRLNLPTWLGVGDALAQEYKANPLLLKEMVNHWPWFQTLIDLLEMILVKSDLKIAENYDKQLVKDSESIKLGEEIREKMRVTSRSVLDVSGSPFLQAHNTVLLRSLTVRNPYIDPLNVIQAEILKRLRSEAHHLTDEQRAKLQDALLITINGIANGMRNSG